MEKQIFFIFVLRLKNRNTGSSFVHLSSLNYNTYRDAKYDMSLSVRRYLYSGDYVVMDSKIVKRIVTI